MPLSGGWLCEVTYTNPLLSPSLKNYITPIKGTGTCPLVPLAMPVTVVQPGFVNGSQSEGAGEGVGGGFPPSHGREIFFRKFLYENSIFLHIKYHY